MYLIDQKLFTEKISTSHLIKFFILHLIFLLSGVALFTYLEGNFQELSLTNWDTNWYIMIRDNGYFYNPEQQSSVAFFPLFPYLWRFSNLSALGICLFNASAFMLGLILYTKKFDVKGQYTILYLSIPSVFFYFIPYSESIFFLFGMLILIGLKEKMYWLVCLALLLSALTRSAGAIFLPALIITWSLIAFKEKKLHSEYILYILSVFLGVLVVSYINYRQTGNWLGFMTIQSQWGHHLQFPSLPFQTWGDRNILRTDGIAIMIGISSIFLLATYLISLLFKLFINLQLEVYQIFSLLYLAGVTSIVLLFEGGGLQSINRYVFASPYFFGITATTYQ